MYPLWTREDYCIWGNKEHFFLMFKETNFLKLSSFFCLFMVGTIAWISACYFVHLYTFPEWKAGEIPPGSAASNGRVMTITYLSGMFGAHISSWYTLNWNRWAADSSLSLLLSVAETRLLNRGNSHGPSIYFQTWTRSKTTSLGWWAGKGFQLLLNRRKEGLCYVA